MENSLQNILDECLNRINNGEKFEDCLSIYPEHAVELESFLRTMVDMQAPLKFIPSPRAKSVAKQRFESAIDQLERRQEVKRKRFNFKPRRVMVFATAASILAIALISYFAINTSSTPAGPGGEVVAQNNFRLLISDEVNAIGDFEHLYVDITSIGIKQGNESDTWQVLEPVEDPDGDGITGLDLTQLQGANAIEIWSGNITPGTYSKLFINVGNVTGYLVGNETMLVKLPSGKLQISKSFTVSDSLINFVFDITVHEAGKSGKYILNPQLAESGPDVEFVDISPDVRGKNEDANHPKGPVRPQGSGHIHRIACSDARLVFQPFLHYVTGSRINQDLS